MVLCEKCKKAQSTFHVTNIDAEGKTELHLCDRCAVEEGYSAPTTPPVISSEILDTFVAKTKATGASLANLICDECGISYIEFRNQGQLGCGRDYVVFKEALLPLIERAHEGATRHVGRAPKSAGAKRPIQETLRLLRRQLEDAVTAEDYERAAALRDRIRAAEAE